MTKIFSPKLFVDGLNRIKAFGIVSVIIMTAFSAFFAIMGEVNYLYSMFMSSEITTSYFAPFLIVMVFVAPIAVCIQLKFLNKRSASDFYHSLPFTRTALCLSYFTAALTWVAAAIIIPLFANSIVYTVYHHATFDLSTPLIIFAVFFGAGFMLMAFMFIAMSLTGTTSSNLVVFCILTFFCRLICLIISLVFSNILYIVPTSKLFGSFLDLDFFPPFSCFSILSSSVNVPSVIYGYAVGIVCTVFAVILFNRRKSESADKTAVSPIFQHIFRCAVALPPALSALILFFEDLLDNSLTPKKALTYTLLLMGSVILYFLYEIITKKGFSTIGKCIPQLFIVFGLSILIYGGIKLTEYEVCSYEPTVVEIKNVQIDTCSYSCTYEANQLAEIKIEDENILQIISEFVHRSNVICRDKISTANYLVRFNVSITDNHGIKRHRSLYLSNEEYENLLKCLFYGEQTKAASLAIPQEDEITKIIGNFDFAYIPAHRLPDNFWSTFVSEYNALSDEDKFFLIISGKYTGHNVLVSGYYGDDYFYSTYYITDKMPQTLQLLEDAAY